MDILVDYRIIRSRTPIDDEDAYRRKVRRNLTDDEKVALARESALTDDPAEIARRAFGIELPTATPIESADDPRGFFMPGAGWIKPMAGRPHLSVVDEPA